ncbi:MAG TPA: hypothetical protein VGQ16_08860 [Vicinamibacterales bacterium]|jgi:hypothetical protein|nr:hypothetical protein [Vicinamibacterales bacterium]
MALIPSALAGGFIGTLVLITIIRAASEFGWTRMDLAFLLGTTVTVNRRKAKAIGYVFQLLLGIVFAILYGEFFQIVGRASWWLGALVGALHAVFVATVLVNILLPVVHPRMGTPETAANEIALIEPPGFLMLNYGRNTFLITLLAHIAYGGIVGLVFNLQ